MTHGLPTPWLLLAALACLAALAWWLARTRTRRGNAARAHVAAHAEVAAERLLSRKGYRVVDRQVTGRVHLLVDGRPVSAVCRADLLVERHGQRWVAEIKSSGAGTRPEHAATRRQLLEYRLAFPVEGVLLVDMAARRIRRVAFPQLAP